MHRDRRGFVKHPDMPVLVNRIQPAIRRRFLTNSRMGDDAVPCIKNTTGTGLIPVYHDITV
jgi:hypothetical protein